VCPPTTTYLLDSLPLIFHCRHLAFTLFCTSVRAVRPNLALVPPYAGVLRNPLCVLFGHDRGVSHQCAQRADMQSAGFRQETITSRLRVRAVRLSTNHVPKLRNQNYRRWRVHFREFVQLLAECSIYARSQSCEKRPLASLLSVRMEQLGSQWTDFPEIL